MKFLILILLAFHNANHGQSSRVLQPKIEHLLFREQYYLFEPTPLANVLKYNELKKHVKKVLDLELGKLHCSIKNICTARIKNFENHLNESYSFCEMYMKYEHNKNTPSRSNGLERFCFFL